MPDPNQGPGQSPFFDLFGRGRRSSRRPRQPRIPARIIQAARAAGPVLQRATIYGTAGYLAYQGLNWYINKKNVEQDLRAIAMLKKQDDAARAAGRAVTLRLEKEKQKRQIIEAGMAAQQAFYGLDPSRPPPPPDARWAPGTPKTLIDRVNAHNAERVRLKAELDEAARIKAGHSGANLPPVYQGPAAAPAAAVPPISMKQKIKAKIAAAAASPFFLPGAALAVALLSRPKAAGSAPEFQDFEVPLTDSQQPEVFFGGELGGVPQLELEPDTGTADDKCEKIDPARSVGECRQGWFSETPEKLYLKEWSRRSCP